MWRRLIVQDDESSDVHIFMHHTGAGPDPSTGIIPKEVAGCVTLYEPRRKTSWVGRPGRGWDIPENISLVLLELEHQKGRRNDTDLPGLLGWIECLGLTVEMFCLIMIISSYHGKYEEIPEKIYIGGTRRSLRSDI